MYTVPAVPARSRTPWVAHLLLGCGMLLLWQSTRFHWGVTFPQFPQPADMAPIWHRGTDQPGGQVLLGWLTILLLVWLLVPLRRPAIDWLCRRMPLSCVLVPLVASLNLALLPQARMEIIAIIVLGTIFIARAWGLRQQPPT